jgi:hypothetical protein
MMMDPRIPPLQLPEIACPTAPVTPTSNNKISIDSSVIHHPPSLTEMQALFRSQALYRAHLKILHLIPSSLLIAMIVPRLLEVDFGFRINKIGTILSNFFDLEMWRVETISVALLYIILM